MNNTPKPNKKVLQQSQPSKPTSRALKADPCGLIHSFVSHPPKGRISPNDVFLLWRISHGSGSNRIAAQAVIRAYGAAMAKSNSAWLKTLFLLFNEMTISDSIGSIS